MNEKQFTCPICQVHGFYAKGLRVHYCKELRRLAYRRVKLPLKIAEAVIDGASVSFLTAVVTNELVFEEGILRLGSDDLANLLTKIYEANSTAQPAAQ